ncbi:MAG: acetoacetate decarboxylase family protein [Thaumarchaeota archaeon]|nr:acetoacetate decarboxylase family protein [Nitrososphaerota archaeon]
MSSGHPLEPAPGGLVEPGPWHYGADYIGVYFKAERETLQALLPKGLQVGDGTCLAYVCEIISYSENGSHDANQDPERTQYGEAAYGIGCSFKGNPGIYFPLMWVDKVWSLARGWFNGYAKRYAEKVIMTKFHPLNPYMVSAREDSELSGYASSGGEKVFSLRVKLLKRGEKADLVNFGATYGLRRFPRTSEGQVQVNELVEVQKYNARTSDVWSGEGKVWFSGIEEMGELNMVRGVMYRSGFSISGAKVLTTGD